MRAAFGFVHVMRGDEERHALPGEFEKQIPEFAPRDRIDARGRLIEKENGRLVHERAGHGEALPPAAGEQRGAAVEIRFEMGERDQFVAALL